VVAFAVAVAVAGALAALIVVRVLADLHPYPEAVP
jgi:hypothetical protein